MLWMLLVAVATGALIAWSPVVATGTLATAGGATFLACRPDKRWLIALLPVAVAAFIPSGHFSTAFQIEGPQGYVTMMQAAAIGLAALLALARPTVLATALRTGPGLFGSVYILTGTTSAVFSTHPLESMAWVVGVGITMLAFGVLLGVLTPSLTPRAIDRTVVRLAVPLAVIALFEFITKQAVLGPLYIATVRDFQPTGAAFRPVALIGNPLVLGAFLAVAFAYGLRSPAGWGRKLALLVIAAATFSTLTRSAIAAVGIALVVVAVSPAARGSRWQKRLTVLAVLVGVGAMFVFFKPTVELRGEFGDLGTTNSAVVRLYGIESSLEVFEQNPLTGVGTGGMKRQYQQGVETISTPDNQLFTWLAELGGIGTVLLLLALGVVARRAVQGRRITSLADAAPMIAFAALSMAFESLRHDATAVLFALMLFEAMPGPKESVDPSNPKGRLRGLRQGDARQRPGEPRR